MTFTHRRVRAIFTDRTGGVSVAPYDSLNLGGGVGDDPAVVADNRSRLAGRAGLPPDDLVWMRQVHGTRVAVVDGPADLAETDGVVTTKGGVGLAVLVADCVPILAADRQHDVIGAAHAGRVGAADGIALALIDRMTRLGANAIQVHLGPAICGRCYEVPADMRDEVEASLPGSATVTWDGTPGLDVRAGLGVQLRELGVEVNSSERCTREDLALYSHRRGAPTGRQAGLIWLAE